MKQQILPMKFARDIYCLYLCGGKIKELCCISNSKKKKLQSQKRIRSNLFFGNLLMLS
jgi:hypothetical protein